VLGKHRNQAGIPGLGQQLRILAGNQHDPLRAGQGEAQMLEGGFVENQNAILGRIRPGNRFDTPRATAAQCFAKGGPVCAVGKRELNYVQHGGLHASTPEGYFAS
jgi:hypothetical protein